MLQKFIDAFAVLKGEKEIYHSDDVHIVWSTDNNQFALVVRDRDPDRLMANEELALLGAYMMLQEADKGYQQCLEHYYIRAEQRLL